MTPARTTIRIKSWHSLVTIRDQTFRLTECAKTGEVLSVRPAPERKTMPFEFVGPAGKTSRSD